MADTLLPGCALRIGQSIDFMGGDSLRYRGTVVDIRDGVALASVLGYPFLFPLLPVTPDQAQFILDGGQHPTPAPQRENDQTEGA
jgi:hypothetical protein